MFSWQTAASWPSRSPEGHSFDGWPHVLWVILALLMGTWGCRYVDGADPPKLVPSAASAGVGETGDPWTDGKLPTAVTAGEPRMGGRVVVQIYSEPPSLNPIVHADYFGAKISERVYDALVGVDPYDDPGYRHIPKLAERWEVSDDKKDYTFHLRPGVLWHDGKPFTSQDVVATFDKIQDSETRAAHVRSMLQELLSYEAVGTSSVRFRFKRPYYFALDMVFADVPIQPAHIIRGLTGREYNEASSNPLNRHPIGTGPFKMVNWESNTKITLERNERYWGQHPSYLKELVFRHVSNPMVALQLAERGELDVVSSIPAERWVDMKQSALRERFWRSKVYDASYAWIGWNMRRAPFDDARVRKAMTLLTDRPGMIKGLTYGLNMPTTCHFYWKSDACPQVEPLPYSPAQAGKVLDEAGWKDTDADGVRDKDGKPLRFTFMVPEGSAAAMRMAAKMKEDFRRAGVEIGLEVVEWTAFTRRLREGGFDACTLLWAGGPRSDPSQIWHSSSINGGSNYIGFKNARADELIEAARVEFDDAKRNEMYRELGKLLHAEQPYTWLWVRPRLELLSKRIHGARQSLLWWQFEDWWVED